MTPEQATRLLVQYKLAGRVDTDYRDALHTIAGMTYEYGVQQRGEFIPLPSGDAIEMAQASGHRVMCRLVGEPEEL